MKRLFSALNVIETKSLTLTKEVLRQRGERENLQAEVKLGLAKLEAIKQESETLQTHEAEITANGEDEWWDYEQMMEEQKQATSVLEANKRMEQEYDCLQEEVVGLMERSAQCLHTLREIAL